jgi:hypothetical protein
VGNKRGEWLRKGLFLAAIAVCCLPFWTTPMALALGLAFGVAGANPWLARTARYSGESLRWSIVGLGFGMDLQTVLHAGRTS